MKSVDDALELRGRILGAFEQAERSSDPARREKLLTFTVVGAGPTGVEMAGQIAELADHTLKGAFRHIDSTQARVILLDAAPAVLPPMGEKLGKKAQARLEKMGVEIQLGAMVTDVDRNGITVKDSDGTIRRIECATKVWSAGVSASPLGRDLAQQSDVEVDRAGRVKVLPDLSHPRPSERFRRRRHGGGRRRARHGAGRHPGRQVCGEGHQGRTQGRRPRPTGTVPVLRQGFDGDGFAVLAVAKVGPLEFGGFIAWLAWLVLHLVYLVGFKTKITTLLSWTVTFLSRARGNLTITEQQAYARTRIEELEEIAASIQDRKSGELESLALPRRQAAAAGECECDTRGRDFGFGILEFADACHRASARASARPRCGRRGHPRGDGR